jgi:hypothetical protein
MESIMKTSLTVFTLLLLTTSIFASHSKQYKIVTEDASFGFKDYLAQITYPSLLPSSVTAYKKINQSLRDELLTSGCVSGNETQAELDEYAPNGMDYEASVKVIALNKDYVGLEVMSSSYCGGAHPNYGTYNYTYNSKTGKLINMRSEVPISEYDHQGNELYTIALSKVVLGKLILEGRHDNGCYEDSTINEALESIQMAYPTITGLTSDKQVIISTSPAHANMPCRESVKVSYQMVKKYIKAGSILHKILK